MPSTSRLSPAARHTVRAARDCRGSDRPKSKSATSPICRVRDLQRLLPMWPTEIADESAEARRRLMTKLRRALREERRRGLAGHWAYDLARHAALFRAYQTELAAERLQA